MKIVLAGYYGCGNLGDEAILESLINGIRELDPDSEITVLSGDPAQTSQCFGVKSIKRISIFQIIKAISRCDVFILGGGGLLQDATSHRSLRYYLSLINTAKFFRKRTVLIGQGIGPLKSAGGLRKALKNVDLITVRDEPSLKILKDINVQAKKTVLTADMALLAGEPDREKGLKLLKIDGITKCRKRLIGISVRPQIGNRGPIFPYKEIASMCDHLTKEKDCQVVFLIFKYPDDLEISEKVMGFMKYPAHVFFRQCKPSDMISVISVLDAVIGMRLHSLIFAAKSGVPAFGLSYDMKIDTFQRIVGQPSVPFHEINGKILSFEIDKFIDEIGGRTGGVEVYAQKARSNLSLLNELLSRNRIDVLGVEIDNVTMTEAVERIEELLDKNNHHLVVTPNPEMIMAAQYDLGLRSIINNASLAPADGIGLMIAGKILGRTFKERVAGIDLMMRVIRSAKEKRLNIFLLGGAEGVAEAAAGNIDANVAGVFHGYSMNDQLMIDKIHDAKADILFVGMGSPKQEKWASRHLRELNMPLVMCVGGSLDVLAGKVKRAPKWMRKAGLEWLWRLVSEPRRWRRMLALPLFFIRVIGARYGR